MRELVNSSLPKWPQMLTVGKRVECEQAKEVIRRTDRFFTSPEHAGHDQEFREWAIAELGMPVIGKKDTWDEYDRVLAKRDRWLGSWGFVDTCYVHNDWIACSYIHGPHGWMHPNGRILFVDNVGKWPSVKEVLADWKELAQAFPFVELDSVLMDREYGEDGRQPVVGFHVEGGKVEMFDPDGERDLVASMMQTGDMFEANRPFLPGSQGVPRTWITDWKARKLRM